MSPSQFENAETVDATAAAPTAKGSHNALRAAARGMVALVEGSTPHLTGETRDVLRRRLRSVALLFFAGFLAFLLRAFLPSSAHAPGWLLATHGCVTLLMGLVAVYLSTNRELSLGKLRLMELIVFGDPAVYFLLTSQYRLSQMANLTEGAHLPVVVIPWLLLVFTYALFIPNSWRRALGVIGPMGVAPIAVIAMQHAYCPGYQSCITRQEFSSYAIEQTLVMALAVATAVLGVYTINALRVQAFEAKQLGQYLLRRRIGSGGMGEVYLAEHQMMKRPCAVKVIRPEKAGDPRTMARFEREVRSTAKLSHWNSIDIYDYGNTPDGTFYYVMEYLPGHNMGELVDEYGPMPPERVVYLIDQVCKALSEAHGMGLVHRDIKPANIFCAYRGGESDVAKLLDFGLAKPILDNQEVDLTQEGAITGSPLFMSPEQATGEREADARGDIYSLGCVMYFMLTGRLPFEYKQSVKVIIAHASEQPASPRSINPDIPPELDEVVMRCLEKDPEDRFQDVQHLRQSLLDLTFDDEWSSQLAAQWWSRHGCPERKAMAAALIDAAAEGVECPWPSATAEPAAAPATI